MKLFRGDVDTGRAATASALPPNKYQTPSVRENGVEALKGCSAASSSSAGLLLCLLLCIWSAYLEGQDNGTSRAPNLFFGPLRWGT